jgi:hypothetical protein
MSYRRRNYFRRYNYARVQQAARNEISAVSGGIDSDIKRIFLALPSLKLETLLGKYRLEHGASAESYARKAYPKWQSGSVQMSGMVAERLLNLVPLVIDSGTKFELVRKIRAAYNKKDNRRIHCLPENWRAEVTPIINEVVAKSSAFQLPAHVVSRIGWLADGDTAAAHKILTAIEEEEASTRIRYLDAEFRRIEVLLGSIQGKKEISHEIVLPQGTISIHIGEKRGAGCLALIFPFLFLFNL